MSAFQRSIFKQEKEVGSLLRHTSKHNGRQCRPFGRLRDLWTSTLERRFLFGEFQNRWVAKPQKPHRYGTFSGVATLKNQKERENFPMTKKEYTTQLKDYPSALTVPEVAEILRVSTKTVYKEINEKRLPAIKVGRGFRVAKSNLIEYLRSDPKNSSHPIIFSLKKTSDNVWTCEPTCGIVRCDRKEKTKGVMQNGKKNKSACCQHAG